jgi:hypothetical protein
LHWLKSNPGKWRSLHDIQEEAARLRSAIESETNLEAGPAEPKDQTFFRDIREGRGEKSAVTLNDAPVDDTSPLYQPSFLSVPEPTIIDGTTKAKLLRGATVILSGASGSKEETTPLGGLGRKRGRKRDGQSEDQKLPAEGAKASRMELMRIVTRRLNPPRVTRILVLPAMSICYHSRKAEHSLSDAQNEIASTLPRPKGI